MSGEEIHLFEERPLCFGVDGRVVVSEDRLDTWYFHPRFAGLLDRLEKSGFKVYSIGEQEVSSKVVDGIHKTPKYSDGGLMFIQANNIREGKIVFERNVKRVAREWEEEVLSRYAPTTGDVLVTKDGTIGVCATVPEKYPAFSIFVSVAAIRPNNEFVLPKYLEVILNSRLGREQVVRHTRGAVLSHLLLEEIKKIKIPVPPIEVQKKVAEIMEAVYEARDEKIKMGDSLIKSIDTVVSDGLGIRSLSIKNKGQFWVVSDEELKDRLDPAFYSPRNISLVDSLKSSGLPVRDLDDLCESIVSGQRPKGGVRYINEGVLSIGGEHITNDGEFDFSEMRFIPREFHEKQMKSAVSKGDILVVKDGATTGKTAFVRMDFPYGESNTNEHVFKLTIQSEYNPLYVFAFLFSTWGQEQIWRAKSGAAQKGITRSAIKTIKIIVPPRDKQDSIAKKVEIRRRECIALIKEAMSIVQSAKEEVEKMVERCG